MKTNSLLCLWLPLVLVCACVKFQEPFSLSGTSADETKVGIRVRLSGAVSVENLSGEDQTRSSWTGNPDHVASFVLMAYREGHLESCSRGNVGETLHVSLFKGRRYQLYALANVPDFVPPPTVSMLESLSLPVGDFQEREFLPMSCRVMDFIPLAEGQALALSFKRLFAQLRVHLDKGALGLLRVGGLRLRQAASLVHPFATTDVAASDTDETFIDGDAASDVDLQRLNAGDNLILYVPQNRQGNLLPGNEDPFLRVPDSLGDKAGQCTYLELSAGADEETLLSGSALCRVYLGLNSADNFDVPGNAVLDLTLFLTERLLGGDWGWRIDSRLSWRGDAVTGWLDQGMHSLDDLYVGEVFRYAVQPSDAFLEAIGGDFSRCSLCFCRNEGSSSLSQEESDTTLLFSSWTPSGDGVWLADAHCRKPVDAGSIRLCLDGHELFDLTTGLAVQVPEISLQEPSDVCVNADTLSVCPLDVRDRQGRSLAAAYGFDPDVLALECDLTVSPEWEAPSVSSFSRLSVSPPTPTAPLGACLIGIFHTGDNQSLSRFLTESLRRDAVFSLRARDNRYGIEASCPFRTDIRPIQVHLTDGGTWDADWQFRVSNPSALPMEWGLVVKPLWRYGQSDLTPGSSENYAIVMVLDQSEVIVERERVVSTGVLNSLSLDMSAVGLSTHCQSCGCSYINVGMVGLEPSFGYGSKRDARLDGKIEWTCSLEGDPPLLCLFASDTECWNGANAYQAPVLLRYSAYDDIGQVQIAVGVSQSGLCPTVTLLADEEEHLFNVGFYGAVNGFVDFQSSGYSHPMIPVPYSVRGSFLSSLFSVPADGRTRFFEQESFSARCQEILERGTYGGNNNNYVCVPRLEFVEYGVGLSCEPEDRIFTPLLSQPLRFYYYSPFEDLNLYVSSNFTGFALPQLFVFSH